MEEPAEPVCYHAANRIVTLTMNDPERRNALSREMVKGLLEGCERAREDDQVRCLVIASAHEKVWCAGGDLGGFRSDASIIEKYFGSAHFCDLVECLLGFPKPTICAAGGHVLAGGLGLALACDFVIAKDGAKFSTPEVNVGLFPFTIAALINRNVSRKQATQLMLLGEPLTAQQACEVGIATRVERAEEFDSAVASIAARLAAKSPLVMRLGKEALRRQMDMSLSDSLALLRANLALALSSDDVAEGTAAFFEKRAPVWAGR